VRAAGADEAAAAGWLIASRRLMRLTMERRQLHQPSRAKALRRFALRGLVEEETDEKDERRGAKVLEKYEQMES
jgi:hypothetical protein